MRSTSFRSVLMWYTKSCSQKGMTVESPAAYSPLRLSNIEATDGPQKCVRYCDEYTPTGSPHRSESPACGKVLRLNLGSPHKELGDDVVRVIAPCYDSESEVNNSDRRGSTPLSVTGDAAGCASYRFTSDTLGQVPEETSNAAAAFSTCNGKICARHISGPVVGFSFPLQEPLRGKETPRNRRLSRSLVPTSSVASDRTMVDNGPVLDLVRVQSPDIKGRVKRRLTRANAARPYKRAQFCPSTDVSPSLRMASSQQLWRAKYRCSGSLDATGGVDRSTPGTQDAAGALKHYTTSNACTGVARSMSLCTPASCCTPTVSSSKSVRCLSVSVDPRSGDKGAGTLAQYHLAVRRAKVGLHGLSIREVLANAHADIDEDEDEEEEEEEEREAEDVQMDDTYFDCDEVGESIDASVY
uniref:Uncharacterized protein n=1 Tax=Trypanosoma vivax (strain Y486) TaxID=1055687 RepID=G0U932_TRYVY|nr:conserved hypothetical protein, fragment [Trypanosoma vivax Y486]